MPGAPRRSGGPNGQPGSLASVLVLVLLFIVLPVAELYVLVQVAQQVGVLGSLALMVVVSVVGAWLVKLEGIGLLGRVRRDLAAGRMPTDTVIDGFLILLAGALLLTPGFITDCVAVLLLLPPTRKVIRTIVLRSFRQRLEGGIVGRATSFGGQGFGGAASSWTGVVDVEEVEVVDRRDDPRSGPAAIEPL